MGDAVGVSGKDVILAVVPMFHANAWGLPYNAGMTGTKLVLPGPKMGDAETLVDLMNTEGVTMAAGVPTVWTLLLNYLAQTGKKVPTLTKTLVGGSAVPLSMIRTFEEQHGVRVLQGWGMTETSPLGTVGTLRPEMESLPAEERYRMHAKQGHGIFGIEMRVVDDDGKELPWDGKSAGELQVRGNWVCSAYFGLDHSPAHSQDGWFATGDVAVIGPDGFLQITDRAKDVIKSGGEWISSVDLENCACGHPRGADGGGHRRAAPEVGRAAAAARGAAPGLHADARLGARAHRRALREVAAAGRGDPGRVAADDGDRQDQQEGPAREVQGHAGREGAGRGLSAACPDSRAGRVTPARRRSAFP